MNRLPYEAWLGLRYMMSRRKDAFISLITLISTAGVALGVAALIVVLSVMNGFEEDLKEKILGTNAHLVVLRSGDSVQEPHLLMADLRERFGEDIEGMTPFIYNQGMLTSRSNVVGAVIRGVDLHTVTTVTEIKKYIVQGTLDSLAVPLTADPENEDLPGIGLGKELANNLAVLLGDTVNLVSPTGEITPFGSAPRLRQFEVRMIFASGMYEYDSALAYINLPEAAEFYGLEDGVTGIEIKLHDPDESDTIAYRMAGFLGFPYYTRDWKEMNRNLFGALKLEKFAMSIILILIVLVAAFNIVSTLFMVVIEKGRDIAILKSMGASRAGIRRIFVMEGVVVGAVGGFLGLAGGLGLSKLVEKYQFIKLPRDIYYIDRLPVVIRPEEVAMIVGGAMLISVLATLYPAWRASRIDPAEGIRYGGE